MAPGKGRENQSNKEGYHGISVNWLEIVLIINKRIITLSWRKCFHKEFCEILRTINATLEINEKTAENLKWKRYSPHLHLDSTWGYKAFFQSENLFLLIEFILLAFTDMAVMFYLSYCMICCYCFLNYLFLLYGVCVLFWVCFSTIGLEGTYCIFRSHRIDVYTF